MRSMELNEVQGDLVASELEDPRLGMKLSLGHGRTEIYFTLSESTKLMKFITELATNAEKIIEVNAQKAAYIYGKEIPVVVQVEGEKPVEDNSSVPAKPFTQVITGETNAD